MEEPSVGYTKWRPPAQYFKRRRASRCSQHFFAFYEHRYSDMSMTPPVPVESHPPHDALFFFIIMFRVISRPQSICYGLNGSGIESRQVARFSAPVQTGPGAHPDICTGSFSRGKPAGSWRRSPAPSSVEVKERVELYIYALTGSWGRSPALSSVEVKERV